MYYYNVVNVVMQSDTTWLFSKKGKKISGSSMKSINSIDTFSLPLEMHKPSILTKRWHRKH